MKYSFKTNAPSNGMKLFSRICIFLVMLVAVVPFTTRAATVLDSVPDDVKSKYTFDGQVNAVITDGTTLYVGGSFTTVTPRQVDPPSFSRSNLAAIDLTTYTLTTFAPSIGGSVNALALSADSGTLYVGGAFTCIGTLDEFNVCTGDIQNKIAAFDTAGAGSLLPFNPDIDGDVNAFALSSDGTPTLYVGGAFTNVGASPRDSLAAFDMTDNVGTLLAFDPNVNDTVNALALSLDETTLYATGSFTKINGVLPQQYLAAFNSTTGATRNFKTVVDGTGRALERSSDGATLYVGGGFSNIMTQSGEGVPFNETTQVPRTTYPKVWTGAGGGGSTIYASIPDGSGGWYIGGSFTNVGTTSQPRLAHITASGLFDSSFRPDINLGEVFTLELRGTTLYAGGSFVVTDGSRGYLAAFNTTNGSVTAFNPSVNGYVYDIELSSDGATLYLGGDFGILGGQNRLGVGAYSTAGAGAVLAFDPDMRASGVAGNVNALELTSNDSTLYVGGVFDSVKYGGGPGTSRNNIAAFTTAGAGAVTAFNPNADNEVKDLLLSGDETKIYAGGSFANIGGQSRYEFAEITVADGLATALDAGIQGQVETALTIGLSSDESTIYIGGENFTVIGYQPRLYFGEIDAVTGLATDFNPKFTGPVRTIAVDTVGHNLFIGGSFTTFGTVSAPYLLGINLSDNSLKTAFAPTLNAEVYSLALTSDDALLYAAGYLTDGFGVVTPSFLKGLDTADGSATTFAPVGMKSIYGMALKPDDSELYVGHYGDLATTDILVFDVDGGVVVDVTAPVITLLGDTQVYLNLGDSYADAGAAAEDDTDGDITADIVIVNPVDTNVVGTYTITYNVQDAAGNPAVEVTRTVYVTDDIPPVITLLGSSDIELTVGSTYTDAGATAEDNVDGDITADIEVGGDVVNPSVVGTYVITYNVQDNEGNSATEVTRTVTIVSQEDGSGGSLTGRSGAVGSGSGKDLLFLLEKLTEVLRQYLMLLLAEKQQ